MTWRLRIRHVTTFHYEVPVVASYNEARLTPITSARQTTMEAAVEVRPAARLLHYWDYWGTLVHAFDLHQPHGELVVRADAVVETTGAPARAGEASWAELGSEAVADRFHEYLAPSVYVAAEPFVEVAADLRAAAPTPAQAASAAAAWTHGQLTYEPGATHVATSAAEVWSHRRGVCQDFAHVSLAVLRAMRIPARYVSGYLHPDGEGPLGTTAVGESHAWVEAWTGEWSPVDPTNLVPVAERHVVVARGRDYRDVPPIKGVYSGRGGSSTEVSVEITRLS